MYVACRSSDDIAFVHLSGLVFCKQESRRASLNQPNLLSTLVRVAILARARLNRHPSDCDHCFRSILPPHNLNRLHAGVLE